MICLCCSALYFLIVILISILIGLRFTVGIAYSNHDQPYLPTDTRLIPVSNSFCQALKVKTKYDGANEYNISLSMLPTRPWLFEQRNFSIAGRIVALIERHYLFYLNQGTEITASACFLEESRRVSRTSLYISKGFGAYDGGLYRRDIRSIVAESSISEYCGNNTEPLS